MRFAIPTATERAAPCDIPLLAHVPAHLLHRMLSLAVPTSYSMDSRPCQKTTVTMTNNLIDDSNGENSGGGITIAGNDKGVSFGGV